ncbi:MAG: tRNA lysidine(34) synthetase TilS [Cytophagaceae bacterium]|jgi:tRNA(Ile)-lysidine synthase|nr:tRNA lysidine(34) synthetase TilS [Cytophagaceae bacterium]
MLGKFNKYIKENGLFTQNDPLLVAVSGGLDSSVLVRLLLEGGYCFAIAHMNFGLRGLESDENEEFVARLALEANTPFYKKKVDLMEPRWDGSIQMRARQARYEWFEEIMEQHGYRYLLTAHHADDHLETLLLQLGRGGKLDQMAGIPLRNKKMVRPLLFASRQDLVQYAKALSLPWSEDSSNEEDKYQRNFLRHHVIPELKEVFPGIHEALQHQYQRNLQVVGFLKSQLEKEASVFCEQGPGKLSIHKKLTMHPQAALLLQHLVEPYGFGASRVQEMLHSAQPGACWHSTQYQCWNDRQHWIISPLQNSDDSEYDIRQDTTRIQFGNGFYLNLCVVPKEDFYVAEHIAWLHLEALQFPLRLRPARPGDRIQPLGMDGSKKISDLLIDMKVSSPDKKHTWVLESAGEIAWVIGYRISHAFRILPKTKWVYKIEFGRTAEQS